MDVVTQALPLLTKGMGLTLQITVISLLIAPFVGLLSCFMGISKNRIFRFLSGAYVYIIRGTPFIVQLFFIYFGVPPIIQSFAPGFRIDKVVAGIITIILNAGAYMSEIFRGGILSVDKGQMEAARSLGLPHSRAMLKVILPQAIKMSIPALTNQVIISFKDVSLISMIGVAEIVLVGKMIVGRNQESTIIYGMIGVMYLVVVAVLTQVAKMIERKAAYEKSENRKSS